MEKEPTPLDSDTERKLDDGSNWSDYASIAWRLHIKIPGETDLSTREKDWMPVSDDFVEHLEELKKEKVVIPNFLSDQDPWSGEDQWSGLSEEEQEEYYKIARYIVEHPAKYVGYVDLANAIICLREQGGLPSDEKLNEMRSHAWEKHIYNDVLGNNKDQKIG